MKEIIAIAALGLALTGSARAEQIKANAEVDVGSKPLVAGLEEVDSIPALVRPDSWSAVDDDTLIVWATPFDPYLVKLYRPSPDLRFAQAIGLTSFGTRIYAKFDSVKIAGFSYPIRGIYKLSRADAKELAKDS
ncbi:MAG TPA: DUF6491 family protein [Gammaproteobacteria bacterium]|nr:DUF6491 family protein [Gammaproteobacteria bacterium]